MIRILFVIIFCTAALYHNVFAIDCPPGYEEDPQYGNCTQCQDGYYSPGGSWGCEACPAGTRATGRISSDDCELCPVGHFSREGSTVCSMCPKGHYADQPGTSNQCNKCAPGTYNDEIGQSQCKPCPPNTYSDTEGAKECQVCPDGSTSQGTGNTSCSPVSGGNDPVQCAKGYFSASGNEPCQKCQAGTYADKKGLTQCKLCPPNTYFSGTGATSRNQCQACPTGKTSPAGSTSQNDCTSNGDSTNPQCNCPTNQACKSATDTTCIPCGETPQSGITAQGICKMCNLGYIFDGTKCTQARIISPEQMKKCMGKIDPDEFKRCALGDY